MGWRDAYATVTGTARTAVGPATVATLRTGPDGGASWRGVWTSPVELHRAAALDRNVYAIARCISSEVGTSNAHEALAVAETIVNAAKLKGVDPYQWLVALTSAARSWTRFYYGEQSGRRASTRQDPDARGVRAAELAIAGKVGFVGGAVSWFEPDLQDSGRQGGTKLGEDAAELARRWAKEDLLQWVGPLPGIDPYKRAAFMRKVAATDRADPGPLLDVIARGRRGEPTMGASSAVTGAAATDAAGEPWWLLAATAATMVLL